MIRRRHTDPDETRGINYDEYRYEESQSMYNETRGILNKNRLVSYSEFQMSSSSIKEREEKFGLKI